MRSLTTFLTLILLFVFLPMSNNLFAAKKVYVRVTPPAPKKVVVVRSTKPSNNAIWIEGRWKWNNGKWIWVKGYWQKTKVGFNWVSGHWKHTPNGWVWIEGYWVKQ